MLSLLEINFKPLTRLLFHTSGFNNDQGIPLDTLTLLVPATNYGKVHIYKIHSFQLKKFDN